MHSAIDGWSPEEPFAKTLFRDGKPVAHIIKQEYGWEALSPLGDSIGTIVKTREMAKAQAEGYVAMMAG